MSSHNQYTIVRKAVGASGPARSLEPRKHSSEDETGHVQGQAGGIYWKAYTTMTSSLLCGMLLAVGMSQLL
jgi:hypothetical protein